ncbi:MAG: hypothetical protein A3G93_07205 [Nitrospinae bacterium RIFCSPLOWO2_12_FULL_45_22]|nr:MAG: hypothetical protein A3G93_07205 [Nitrospinae bacterium RIFCSPLOWO2_12_FULL_45_22]
MVTEDQNKSKQEDFFEGLTLWDIDNFISRYDNALTGSLPDRYSHGPDKRPKELLKKLTEYLDLDEKAREQLWREIDQPSKTLERLLKDIKLIENVNESYLMADEKGKVKIRERLSYLIRHFPYTLTDPEVSRFVATRLEEIRTSPDTELRKQNREFIRAIIPQRPGGDKPYSDEKIKAAFLLYGEYFHKVVAKAEELMKSNSRDWQRELMKEFPDLDGLISLGPSHIGSNKIALFVTKYGRDGLKTAKKLAEEATLKRLGLKEESLKKIDLPRVKKKN